MDPDSFCAALVPLTHEHIDGLLDDWRSRKTCLPSKDFVDRAAALLSQLDRAQLRTMMEMMREANAVSLFHLLNVIDGTGDLEGQPIGGFKLLFQQWEGAEGEELLNDENAAFLHERFMDAHMRALEREGIV